MLSRGLLLNMSDSSFYVQFNESSQPCEMNFTLSFHYIAATTMRRLCVRSTVLIGGTVPLSTKH